MRPKICGIISSFKYDLKSGNGQNFRKYETFIHCKVDESIKMAITSVEPRCLLEFTVAVH